MTAPTASPVNVDHSPLEPFRSLIHENNRLVGDGRVYLIARGTRYPITPVTFLPRGTFVHVTTREQELFWFGQTARR